MNRVAWRPVLLDGLILCFAGYALYSALNRPGIPETPGRPSGPAMHERLPDLEVVEARPGRTGLSTTSFPDTVSGPMLVFVSVSSCPACEQVSPQWRELGLAVGDAWEVVAMSLESAVSTRAWLDARQIQVDRILQTLDASRLIRDWDVTVVPTTLVLREGKLVAKYKGVLSGDDRLAILSELRAFRPAGR